ncbi:MAG: trypsin-like peptidase domain-containing protein [Oscillospiraceae bacterium]|nr:trypsin-like peptidase domain-containing protein [Oscillospiraceae bacterium]
MDDKRTPMEAEVQELPPRREAACPEDFYGTAAKPRPRRSHTWAWILMGLAVIAACTAGVVAALSHVRVDTSSGGWRLALRESEETQAGEDPVRSLAVPDGQRYVPAGDSAEGAVGLELDNSAAATLDPAEIYRRAEPSVVCVQVDSYYGTEICSGVVLSADGYILSATEGLSNAASVTVSFSDGRSYSARRVGEERSTGLCLLKVEAAGLQPAVFCGGEPQVGQSAWCVCNPYGSQLPNVFIEGMLSARRTMSLGDGSFTLLQFSGQLRSPGSGCPILDGQGRVLGLSTHVGRQFSSGEEPCFAIAAGDLARVVAAFADTAARDRCWLGLEVEDIPEEYVALYGFPGSLWIDEVAAGTAPYGVLYQYDVITAVDGTEVRSAAEFDQVLAAHKSGDRVRLTIFRSGKWYTILLPVLAR